MIDLYLSIPIQPITKKNSSIIITNRQTGRPILIPSEPYRKYEKASKPFVEDYKNTLISEPINEPVNVKAYYYMGTKRKVDLCNLHAALHDMLVKHGFLEDDNFHIIVATDGSRVKYDKDNPRTEIWITSLCDEEA